MRTDFSPFLANILISFLLKPTFLLLLSSNANWSEQFSESISFGDVFRTRYVY